MSDQKIRVPPKSRKACSENNLGNFSSQLNKDESEDSGR